MTMSESMVCWKCGASIKEHPLPLSRSAECKHCLADLYVCKMCIFYDTGKAKSCQETIADEVKDKERANFCDYLKLKPNAFTTSGHAAKEEARRRLEALFGHSNADNANESKDSGNSESTQSKNPHLDALENLFKK